MPTVPNYNINSTAETSINTAKRRITGLNKVQTNELTESVPGNQLNEDMVDDILYKITHKINFDIIVELKKLKSYLQIANVDKKGRDPASLREFVSSSAKIEPNVKEILAVLKKLYKNNAYNFASLGVFTDFLTAVDEALTLVKEIAPISNEFERKVLRDNPALAGLIAEIDDVAYNEAYLTGAVQVGKTHWNELVSLANDLQANRPVSRYVYNRILDGGMGNSGFVPPSRDDMVGGNWLNNIASAFEVATVGLDKHIKGMFTDPAYRKSVDNAWEETVWQNIDPTKVIPRLMKAPAPAEHWNFKPLNPFSQEGKDRMNKQFSDMGNWITGTVSEAIDDDNRRGGSLFSPIGNFLSSGSLLEDPVSRMMREAMSGQELSAFKQRSTPSLTKKRGFFGFGDNKNKGGFLGTMMTPMGAFQAYEMYNNINKLFDSMSGSGVGGGLTPQETRQLNQLRELMKDIDPGQPSASIQRKIAQLEAKESGTSEPVNADDFARELVSSIVAAVPEERRGEKSTKAQKAAATKNMKRLAEALRKTEVEKDRVIVAAKNTGDALTEALDDFENVLLLQPEMKEMKGLSPASLHDLVARLFLEAYGDVDETMMREIAKEALDESAAAAAAERRASALERLNQRSQEIRSGQEEINRLLETQREPAAEPEPGPEPAAEPEIEDIEREPSPPASASEIDAEEIDYEDITDGRPFDPSVIAYIADRMTDKDYWEQQPGDMDGGRTIDLDEEDSQAAHRFVVQLLEQIKDNEDEARELEERNKKNKLFKYAKEIINLMPAKITAITKLIMSLQEATKHMITTFNTRRKQYALSDSGIEERVKQGGSMYDRSFNENNLKLYNSSGLPKYI